MKTLSFNTAYSIDIAGRIIRNGRPIKKIKKGNREVVHLYNKGLHKKFYVDELLREYYPQWEPPEGLKIMIDKALKDGRITTQDIKTLYDIEM